MMSAPANLSDAGQVSPTRRRLIQAAAWLSFGPAALTLAWDLLQYLVPRRRRPSFRKIFVARSAELPGEDVYEMVDLNGRPLAIIQRPGGSPVAFSLSCTRDRGADSDRCVTQGLNRGQQRRSARRRVRQPGDGVRGCREHPVGHL